MSLVKAAEPKLKRPLPRRAAWLYPEGTTLTLRDGRTFEVVRETIRLWDDPSMGNGGGEWVSGLSQRMWRQIR